MIQIQLNSGTLENIRYGYSPLLEVALSYQVLTGYKYLPPSQVWLENARQVLHNREFPFLDALVPPCLYLADLLTPAPTSAADTLESQLEDLRQLSPETIRQQMETVILYGHRTPVQQFYMVDPHGAIECLIEEIRTYWHLLIAPTWSQARGVLEQDMLHRARHQALHGISQTLGTLTPDLTYSQFTITIDRANRPPFEQTEFRLDDAPLYLIPSIFKQDCGVSWQMETGWSPMIAYSARGQGLIQKPRLPEPEKQLIQAFGASRARLLLALREPVTTLELSHRLHMASSSISQQLKRLRAAGLVESQRSGQYVYYRLSRKGENLISVFEGGD
jgi:DNA-binding transcriptional ArsR family regulator